MKVFVPGGGAAQPPAQDSDLPPDPTPPALQAQQYEGEREGEDPAARGAVAASTSGTLDAAVSASVEDIPIPPELLHPEKPPHRAKKLAYTLAVSGWAWEEGQFR